MERLNSIISKVFKIDESEIKDDYGPEDIAKWDSLGQLALISEIETEYRLIFEIDEIFEIMIIGDIKRILKKKMDRTR